MNAYLSRFLEMFDLDSMGFQTFVLIENYPTPHYTHTYMTFGQLYGPVSVRFQGDNVSFLSCFRPIVVSYKKGMGFTDERLEILTDRKTASFHMDDIKNFPVRDLGHQMSRQHRRCRLFLGREEVRDVLRLITERPVEIWDGSNNDKLDILKKMYDVALPHFGMLNANFIVRKHADASL